MKQVCFTRRAQVTLAITSLLTEAFLCNWASLSPLNSHIGVELPVCVSGHLPSPPGSPHLCEATSSRRAQSTAPTHTCLMPAEYRAARSMPAWAAQWHNIPLASSVAQDAGTSCRGLPENTPAPRTLRHGVLRRAFLRVRAQPSAMGRNKRQCPL